MAMYWSASRREQIPALDKYLFSRVPLRFEGLELEDCGTAVALFVHETDAQYPQQNVDFEPIVKPKVHFLCWSPPKPEPHAQ